MSCPGIRDIALALRRQLAVDLTIHFGKETMP